MKPTASNQFTDRLYRFLVYPSDKAQRWLCVCAARDKAHALKIARQNFTCIERTAYAVLER
jgi:hypothetical protein